MMGPGPREPPAFCYKLADCLAIEFAEIDPRLRIFAGAGDFGPPVSKSTDSPL